jgi:hypothetical protein
MARRAWMDKPHEFRENVNDGSMCLCGIPAYYHDDWERQQRDVARMTPYRPIITHTDREAANDGNGND